jgi:hypothetical protein
MGLPDNTEETFAELQAREIGEEHARGTGRDVVADIGAGVVSGLMNNVAGLMEIPLILTDLAADTDLAKQFDEWYEGTLDDMGLTPQGTAGEIAQAAGEFIPLLLTGAFGPKLALQGAKMIGRRTHHLKKMSDKADDFYQAYKRIGATPNKALSAKEAAIKYATPLISAGAMDAVISKDGRTLMADFFQPDSYGMGFAQSEVEQIGEGGRDDALRRIRNRARAFGEGAGMQGAGMAAFGAVGVGMKAAVATGAPRAVARGVTKAMDASMNKIASTKTGMKLLRQLRPHGLSPEWSMRIQQEGVNTNKALQAETDGLFAEMKEATEKYRNGTPEERKAFEELFYGADLTTSQMEKYRDMLMDGNLGGGGEAEAKVARKFLEDAQALRGSIRKKQEALSAEWKKVGGEKGLAAAETIDNSMDWYINRSFRQFTDPKWTGLQGAAKNDAIKSVGKMLDDAGLIHKGMSVEQEATAFVEDLWNSPNKTFKDTINQRFDPVEFKRGRDIAEERFSDVHDTFEGETKLKPSNTLELDGPDKSPLVPADAGILKERKHISEELRAVYGEYSDPLTMYTNTVFRVAAQSATLKRFNDIAEAGLIQGRKMYGGDAAVVRPGPDVKEHLLKYKDLKGFEKYKNYTPIPDDPAFGNLAGTIVHNDLTDMIFETKKTTAEAIPALWATAMSTKAGVQASVTIFNPKTHLGNLYGNIMPMLANANMGRNSKLMESAELAFRHALKMATPEQSKEVARMMGLGLGDTSAIMENVLEMYDQYQKKGGTSKGPIAWIMEGINGEDGANWIQKNLGKVKDVYMAGDHYAKWGAFAMEKGKINNIFGDMLDVEIPGMNGATIADRLAADTVQSTMATFDRMPMFVKTLRDNPLIGNFSSFAAESTRTAFNSIETAINEMAGRIRIRNEWVDVDVLADKKSWDEAAERFGWTEEVIHERRFNQETRDYDWVPSGKGKIEEKYFEPAVDGRESKAPLIAVPGTDSPYRIQKTTIQPKKFASPEDLVRIKKELARTGMRRGMANLATHAATKGLPVAAASLVGVKSEEIEAFRRFAPDWMANAPIIPLGRGREGEDGFYYTSLGPIDYYGALRSTFQVAQNAIDAGAAEGLSLGETAMNAAGAALINATDPFVGLSIPIETATDIFLRKGRTANGQLVYRQTDGLGTKVLKSMAHTANTVLPDLVPFDWRIKSELLDSFGMEKDISDEVARIVDPSMWGEWGPIVSKTSALMGMDLNSRKLDKQGRPIHPLSVALAPFRLNTQFASPKIALQHKGFENSRHSKDISNDFNSFVRNTNNATSDEVINAYVSANRRLLEQTREFAADMDAARTMGMNNTSIYNTMREKKIGKFEGAMDGTFEPMKVSDEILEHIADTNPGLPLSRIQSIYLALEGVNPAITDDQFNEIVLEAMGEGTGDQSRTLYDEPEPTKPQMTGAPAATTEGGMAAGARTQGQAPQQPSQMVNPILLPDPADQALAMNLGVR